MTAETAPSLWAFRAAQTRNRVFPSTYRADIRVGGRDITVSVPLNGTYGALFDHPFVYTTGNAKIAEGEVWEAWEALIPLYRNIATALAPQNRNLARVFTALADTLSDGAQLHRDWERGADDALLSSFFDRKLGRHLGLDSYAFKRLREKNISEHITVQARA